nr:hypothetical protein Iba_chr11eCG7660 [Ipomoea batatas]
MFRSTGSDRKLYSLENCPAPAGASSSSSMRRFATDTQSPAFVRLLHAVVVASTEEAPPCRRSSDMRKSRRRNGMKLGRMKKQLLRLPVIVFWNE